MKYKTIKLVVFLLFAFSQVNFYSQNAATCINAYWVCADSVGFMLTVGGAGLSGGAQGSISNPTVNPQGVNSGCFPSNASGPQWLRFKITSSGNLGFNLGSSSSQYPQVGYYDWELWKLDTNITISCNKLF